MSGIRVINFHGIGTPQRTLDSGEAPYWVSADRFRYMLDRIVEHPDRDNLIITFDNGNLSDLQIGLPELLARGLRAEFFVLTGRLGKPGSLSADDTRALLSAGMSIGSHGIDHRDWSGLSGEDLREELTASRSTLEAICGRSIPIAAIPFGRYNAAVLTAARKAGYDAVYSSDGGGMNPSAFLRPRSTIRSDTTDSAYDAMLDGRLPLMKRLRRMVSMRLKQLV